MSIRKLELNPDLAYLNEALRNGNAQAIQASMKAVIVDRKYQARVKGLDMNHVHRLDHIKRESGNLARVIIFQGYPKSCYANQLILADGHHRYEVYRRLNEEWIPAYIITVGNPEREAMLYAAMCNRDVCLPRTKEDIKHAVEMLFADTECWRWSDNRIAEHCGLTPPTVKKMREEYSEIHDIAMPVIMVSRDEKIFIGRERDDYRGNDYREKTKFKPPEVSINRIALLCNVNETSPPAFIPAKVKGPSVKPGRFPYRADVLCKELREMYLEMNDSDRESFLDYIAEKVAGSNK